MGTVTPLAILYNFSNGIRKNKKFRSFAILCPMEPIIEAVVQSLEENNNLFCLTFCEACISSTYV